MDRHYKNQPIKQELKQVASSVKQLGAHATQAAREWINERKHDMTNRNDRNENQNRTGPRGQDQQSGTQGYDGGSYRSSSEYNQNDPMRGYGEGSSQGAQGTYGVHQREDSDYANRDHSQGNEWRQSGDSRQQGEYQSRSASAYGQPSHTQNQSQGYGQSQGQGASQGYGQSLYQPSSQNPYQQSQSSLRQQGDSHRYGSESTQNYGVHGSSNASQSQGHGQQSAGYNQQGQRSHGYGQVDQGQSAQSGSTYGYGQSGGQMQGASPTSGYSNPYAQGQQQALHRGKGPKGYSRSDDRIQEDLNERLFHDDEIDASDVEVKVSNGVVCLDGTISERRLKYRIEDIAESCSGVKDVTNNLRIASSTSNASSMSSSSPSMSNASSSSTMGYGSSMSGSANGSQGADLKSTGGSKPASPSTRGNAT